MPSRRPFPIRRGPGVLLTLVSLLGAACTAPEEVDLILRGGTLYDGSGDAPRLGDVAIHADSVVALGDVSGFRAANEVDVTGLAVAPGFVNMLSWATETLIHDGRGLSDIEQGVTLEVFGEGQSMAPSPTP